MCTVCGCDGEGAKVEKRNGGKVSRQDHGHNHSHSHSPNDGHAHDHVHGHSRHHHHGGGERLDFGSGPAGVSVPGETQARLIEIERGVLDHNAELAAANRVRLNKQGVFSLNLMSSPGSGKTTLLVETLKALGETEYIAVIEGDQQTSNDAARIRETGVQAIQVNTGKGCHLDAEMVGKALDQISLTHGGLLFIENVGNLVCPASFDLGEARRVVLASVTEGEDKPLKYPDMFASADLMVVTKTDLLPHLDFDVDTLVDNARRIRPELDVVTASTRGAPGLGYWLAWLKGKYGAVVSDAAAHMAAE